ncbi:hypothetical protein AVEN_271393-1, partial [Araneus ventricosus]
MSAADVLSAVKSLEDALKCTICNGLLNDPLLIVKCGHTTCKQCFTNSDMACPVCRVPINSRDSLEDKQLVELLSHLKKLKSFLPSENGDEANEVLDEAIVKSSAKNGPLTSTPKVKRTKSVSKKPSVPSQNKERSIQ